MARLRNIVLVSLLFACSLGCQQARVRLNVSPIQTIAFGHMSAIEPHVAEAMKIIVEAQFIQCCDVTFIADAAHADVLLEGAITTASSSGSAHSGWTGSSRSAASSLVVSGVTLIAKRNGKSIASAQYFQILGRKAILPPEFIGANAVKRLLRPLRQEGLMLRKRRR